MSDQPSWKKSLTQSTRSAKIREIASTLASLDGSNEAAKMVLAMNFEAIVHDKAKNFDDYVKRISKRMTKMKATYKPAPAPEPAAPDPPPAAEASPAADGDPTERDILARHGDTLRYIARRGAKAVRILGGKLPDVAARKASAEQHAERLRANIGLVLRQAVYVGVDVLAEAKTAGQEDDRRAAERVGRRKRARTAGEAGAAAKAGRTPPLVVEEEKKEEVADGTEGGSDKYKTEELFNLPEFGKHRRTPEELKEIDARLKERAENVLDHVQKIVDLNEFMGGKVELWGDGKEAEGKLVTQAVADTLRHQTAAYDPPEAPSGGSPDDDMTAVRGFLKRATVPLSLFPSDPPTLEDGEFDAAAAIAAAEANDELAFQHADRVLAASELFVSVLSLLNGPSRQICHTEKMIRRSRIAAQESTQYLQDVFGMDFHAALETSGDGPTAEEKGPLQRKDIMLEDVWKSPLRYAEQDGGGEVESEDKATPPPSPPLAIRAKILLGPGRAVSRMLVRQLPERGVELMHPPEKSGCGGSVRIAYGTTFLLTAHLAPLLVTLQPTGGPAHDAGGAVARSFHHRTVCGSLYMWGRPHPSVTPALVGSVVRGAAVRGAISEETVRRKLNYASAQATYVLRRCFGDVASQAAGRSDPEVEIIEITALLKFLRIVEANYGYGF